MIHKQMGVVKVQLIINITVNGREDDSDSLRQIVFRSAGDIGLLMERILEQQVI